MAISTHRGRTPAAKTHHRVASMPLSTSSLRQTGAAAADRLFAEDILQQLQSLGLSNAAAVKLLTAVRNALGEALEGLDSHAWTTAPPVQQISMLVPRFEIDRLARECELPKADVQSALALLVMDFVNLSHAGH